MTPFPEEQRRYRARSSETPLTLTGKEIVCSRKRTDKSNEEVSKAVKESNYARKFADYMQIGSRRSSRLNHLVDECEEKKTLRSCNKSNRVSESSVTHSCLRDTDKLANKINYHGSTGNTLNHCLSVERKLLKHQVKDMKKCRNDKCDGFDEGVSDDNMNNGVLSIIENHVLDDDMDKFRKRKDSRVDEVPQVGAKRKRNQVEDDVGISQGWTKDQESALERAYLTANPTPHFWKKVSRLVPGKSAQECFDKIHCRHLTPPQPRPCSRAQVLILNNTSLSASKLLDNSSIPNVKRRRYSKQKSRIIQRTVRHMLQKQYKVEKDSETDLFSVLEPISSPSDQSLKPHLILTTPDCIKGEVLKNCHERSSMAHKKSLSRFGNSYDTTLFSPPVLKQIKNKALHEKYIDRLNCREANRKAEKLHQGKGIKGESFVQRMDAIKAAKNEVVFYAKDAINEFQHQQAKALMNIFDDESGADNDEEEGGSLF